MSDSSKQYDELLETLKKSRLPSAVKKAVLAILEKKGERVSVVKLVGLSDICDYLILCSGQSVRQNQAISDAVVSRLSKEMKTKPFNIEGNHAGDWILIDFIDFIVHVFLPEIREKYALEKMWMDGKRTDFYLN